MSQSGGRARTGESEAERGRNSCPYTHSSTWGLAEVAVHQAEWHQEG